MVAALRAVGGLVGLLGVLMLTMAALGARLPQDHVASESLRLGRTPPERVWELIADGSGLASWAWGVKRVERLPDREGRETIRQTIGRHRVVFETVQSEPSRVLARRMADEGGPFSGSWTYEIRPEGGGCVVTLTEHGRVKGAIPRAMMRYLVGHHLHLERHLRSMAVRFGEPAELFGKDSR